MRHFTYTLLANRKFMDKKQIEERIKDLREQQKEILNRIKNRNFTVDVIINYGKNLERLSIRISELDLLTWQ